MKKFVTLIVVLGMVSVANAQPVLTMDGSAAPTNITLTTSDHIELDIEIDNGFTGGDFQILITPQASLDATGVWFNPNYSFMGVMDMPWTFPMTIYTSTSTSFVFGGGLLPPFYNGDTRTLMDGLILHCDEDTDVVVQLIAYSMINYEETAVPTTHPAILHYIAP